MEVFADVLEVVGIRTASRTALWVVVGFGVELQSYNRQHQDTIEALGELKVQDRESPFKIFQKHISFTFFKLEFAKKCCELRDHNFEVNLLKKVRSLV